MLMKPIGAWTWKQIPEQKLEIEEKVRAVSIAFSTGLFLSIRKKKNIIKHHKIENL